MKRKREERLVLQRNIMIRLRVSLADKQREELLEKNQVSDSANRHKDTVEEIKLLN